MASDVMSLFSMPTQEQLGQQYLQGLMTSPAQMGSQGLLQQVVSLGGNAGAGLGYGVGRLLGGMTAEEVRAKGINDAMQTVQGMGLTSDAEMYGALSQELARRGLTQDALLARNTALKAAQTEQTMSTERQRLGIAQQELGLRKAADAREAEMLPVKIKSLETGIRKDEASLKNTNEKLAEAAAEVERLSVEKPNSPELRAALGRYQGFVDQLAMTREELAMKQEELNIRRMSAGAAVNQGEAALLRAGQERVAGSIGAVPYTDLTGKLTMVPLGRGAGNKIIGSGTGASYTPEEWAGFGAVKEEDALKKKLKIQEDETGGGAGDKNKNKGKDVRSVLENLYSGQQQPNQDALLSDRPIRQAGESAEEFKQKLLAWEKANKESRAQQRLLEQEALRQRMQQRGQNLGGGLLNIQ